MISLTSIIIGVFIILLVGAVEFWLLSLARACVHRDQTERLSELEGQLLRDLEQRAERGLAPDWIRYRAELDRLFEPSDDRLRSLAAAALSTGLGGTILALILHALIFLFIDGGFNTSPYEVVVGIGIGLFGSFAGVACNLWIILLYLPQHEKLFEAATQPVLRRLREASDTHPATEAFVRTLREEMSELRNVLSNQVGQAFSNAIGQFPAILEGLKIQLKELSDVVESQGSNITKMTEQFEDSSRALEKSSERLEPAIKPLAGIAQDLVALPTELSKVLTRQQQVWIEDLDHRHGERWEQLNRLLEGAEKHERAMRAEVAEARRAVEAIPQQLGDAVQNAANTFGDRFGNQARDHLNEYKAFVLEHDEKWRTKIGDMLADLLAEAKHPIEFDLIPRVEAITAKIEEHTKTLASAGKDLAGYLESKHETQGEALESWIATSERIEKAAQAIAQTEEHLRSAATTLETSASDLGRITEIEESFEQNLTASLHQVTDRYLEHLQNVIGEMKQRQERYDAILESQTQVIVDLITRTVERYPTTH